MLLGVNFLGQSDLVADFLAENAPSFQCDTFGHCYRCDLSRLAYDYLTRLTALVSIVQDELRNLCCLRANTFLKVMYCAIYNITFPDPVAPVMIVT